MKQKIAFIRSGGLVLIMAIFLSMFTGCFDSVPVSASAGDGQSAYEMIVKTGYKGSAEQFLASLAGETDKKSSDSQILSSYQMAVDNGYKGTKKDWINTITGETNADISEDIPVYEIMRNNGYTGSLADWLRSLVDDPNILSQASGDEKTAYEYAVEYGYTGDFAEWLAFLVGGI